MLKNKKIQAVLAATMLLASLVLACVASLTPTPALAQESQTQQCIVTVRVLNIRPEAGTAKPATDSFERGESFTLLERNGQWGRHATGWSYLPSTTCGGGTAATGGGSSATGIAGQVCFSTSPTYDQVNIPAQSGLPKVSEDANLQRMFELTQHYRNSGPWVMAKAAGLKWTGVLCLQARNPDELSFAGTDGQVHTVVQALQLWGDAWTVYPSAFSTGEALWVDAGGRLVKFDEHPTQSDDVSGRACTECAVHNGPFSFWPSGAGRVWQLWPDTAECRTEVGVNVPAGGVLPNQSTKCH